jgi:hypothetical protein
MILISFFRLMVLQLLTPPCGTWEAGLSVALNRALVDWEAAA